MMQQEFRREGLKKQRQSAKLEQQKRMIPVNTTAPKG